MRYNKRKHFRNYHKYLKEKLANYNKRGYNTERLGSTVISNKERFKNCFRCIYSMLIGLTAACSAGAIVQRDVVAAIAGFFCATICLIFSYLGVNR